MKILFVIATLANGGAERVLSALSSELAQGNDVHIAVLEYDAGLYEFAPNITFHRPQIYGGNRILAKFRKIAQLRALFKSVAPDIIISFIDWTNVACVVANLGLKFKHIATEHNANEYLQSPKFRLMRDMCYRLVDGLSVLSQSDYEYYDFVKNRVILHNPFFLKGASGAPKEDMILSVGRLEAVKGYEVYFKALALIEPRILEGWRIVIAGGGSLEGELKALGARLNLNVEFLGHTSEVAPLYERAKVFVISSHSEGLPNVLIEAANFGCARVSSATAGGRELIKNGVDGALFEVGNERELAEILAQILQDEKLRERLAQGALESAKEFELPRIMAKWHKFIDEVVAK